MGACVRPPTGAPVNIHETARLRATAAQRVVPLVVKTEDEPALVEALLAIVQVGAEDEREAAKKFLVTALPLGTAVSYQCHLDVAEAATLSRAVAEVAELAPHPVLDRLRKILLWRQ